MYLEPPPTKVTLPLEPNEDPELTCFVCVGKRTCELCFTVRFPGLARTYGIHLECVALAERRK